MMHVWVAAMLLFAGLLANGCSGPKECTGQLNDSFSVITVLAPDGSQICDATVTVDGSSIAASTPPGEDTGCAYLADNARLGNGAHGVVASKSGYQSAQGIIHVTGVTGGCPQPYPQGQDLTLRLYPPSQQAIDSGTPDAGASDAAASDAAD